VAASGALGTALTILVGTPYGHDLRTDQTLAEAERAVAATLLWHVRVLAGWLPREGGDRLRVLAGWFEVANVDELMRAAAGRPAAPAFRLGSLATAWSRLQHATSPAEARRILASSPWGDPGGESPGLVALAMRLSWAERVAAAVRPAARWATGGGALLVARELFVVGRRLPPAPAASARRLLGPSAPDATSLPELVRSVRSEGRWAIAGVDDPGSLWRAEARWWGRVESGGLDLLHRPRFSFDPVLGAVVVLAVDAWRVSAALELAARGAPVEVFDALA
jgi:hypothetical protein